jgi:hypothetical protein
MPLPHYPESRHSATQRRCPFCANKRHQASGLRLSKAVKRFSACFHAAALVRFGGNLIARMIQRLYVARLNSLRPVPFGE